MTSIGGIGWSPRLGSEKSHDVHGWIVVYQKPGVLGWRIHTGCPRLEALTGRGVCVCFVFVFVFVFCLFVLFLFFVLFVLFYFLFVCFVCLFVAISPTQKYCGFKDPHFVSEILSLIYCVSQKEVINILTPYCSKSKKNLTIPVCRTKCSTFLDLCFKYQQNW